MKSKNWMKINFKRFTRIILILFFLFCKSCVISATDFEELYETTKNFIFYKDDYLNEDLLKIYDFNNTNIPSKYSLKDSMDLVTEDQRPRGLCEAFAGMKCLETNYAKKYGTYINFSESYYDYISSSHFYGSRDVSNDEGTLNGEEMFFLETFGTATADDVPFGDYENNLDTIKNAKTAVRIKSTVCLPALADITNENVKNIWMQIIKCHIIKYGSLSVCHDPGSDYFSHTYNSCYYTEDTDIGADHAVSLVGWDDTFPKEHFITQPERDGAFLCLNSWGTDWGDNGYFWVSYEDYQINGGTMDGVLDCEKQKDFNTYNFVKKLRDVDCMDYLDDNAESYLFGFKFECKEGNEYLSHISSGIGGWDTNTNVKIKYYINVNDDTFEKEKFKYLGEAGSITDSGSLNNNLGINYPLKINGEKFAVILEVDRNGDDVCYGFENDEIGNIKQGHTYTANSLDGNWELFNVDIPIYVFTINKSISKVSLKNPPTKTTYVKGEQINLDGCKGTIEYNNGEIEEVTFTRQNSEVSGFDSNKLGTQLIKLTYMGQTVEFNVVVKNEAKSINIKSNPTKLKYAKDETLDLTGGIITITYEDGTTEDVNMNSTNVTSSGFDSSKLGEQEITVKCNNLTATFNVTITNELKSISIKKNPAKTTYIKGEQLDLAGGIITAVFEDNTTADINMSSADVTYSNYDSNKLGNQSITIKYKDLTTTLNVIVKNDATKISVKKAPSKTTYVKGENLDLSGGTINVTYEDNTTAEIPMKSNKVGITGYKSNELGEQEIIVSYNGKITKFNVKVKNDVTKISIKNVPSKTTYIKGENLDLSDGTISVTYEDNTTVEIPMDFKDIGITGFKQNELGEQEITISYYGKTITFNVKVSSSNNSNNNNNNSNNNNNENMPSTSNNTVQNIILPKAGSINIAQGIVLITLVFISVISYILYRKNNFK